MLLNYPGDTFFLQGSSHNIHFKGLPVFTLSKKMNKGILFTVSLAVFIALLGIGIIIPVLPQLAVSLGASGFDLGIIIAAFSLTRGLLQPIVGSYSDRYGRKRFMALGLCAYCLVGVLIPLATSVGNLICVRALQGVGAAMIVPVAMAYVSSLTPAGQEGKYMGVINSAVFCGIGFGPIIGGLIFDYWGFAPVFYAMAVLAASALVLVLSTLPPSLVVHTKQHMGILQNMGKMCRRKRSLGILIARFATVLMIVPTMAFLPLIMAPWDKTSALHVGIVIACRTIMNAALQIPMGAVVDRLNKVLLLIFGCLCMVSALVFIPSTKNLSTMIGLYLFLGAGESVLWPLLSAYAAEEGRTHFGHGAMMGVFNFAMSIGVFTGAIFSGVSIDKWGAGISFYLLAAATLVLTLYAAFLIVAGERGDKTQEQAEQRGEKAQS